MKQQAIDFDLETPPSSTVPATAAQGLQDEANTVEPSPTPQEPTAALSDRDRQSFDILAGYVGAWG